MLELDGEFVNAYFLFMLCKLSVSWNFRIFFLFGLALCYGLCLDGPSSLMQSRRQLSLVFVIGLLSSTGFGCVSTTPA